MDHSIKEADRWISEEWRDFELYEKKRVRIRRTKLLFIVGAGILFLGLCSVPVIDERLPKWKTLRIARDLSVEIEKLKTLAIKAKKPARMTFVDPYYLQIDLVSHCGPTAGAKIEEKPIVTKQWTGDEAAFKILTPAEAQEFSIALVEQNICFDPVDGIYSHHQKQVIAIVPVKDMAEKRLDRASYVIIEGESAKVTLD